MKYTGIIGARPWPHAMLNVRRSIDEAASIFGSANIYVRIVDKEIIRYDDQKLYR